VLRGSGVASARRKGKRNLGGNANAVVFVVVERPGGVRTWSVREAAGSSRCAGGDVMTIQRGGAIRSDADTHKLSGRIHVPEGV
jgi:hypothetical protein